MTAPTLTEFLLARIAEDEADVSHIDGVNWTAGRVMAECESKRRIVEDFEDLAADYRVTHSPQTEARRFQALVSIAHLAAVYADHPDFDEAWRV